jgi:hypothetical protein
MKAIAVTTAVLVLFVVFSAACGSNGIETPTASSSTPPAPTIITFAGSLDVGASRFYSFTARTGGAVSVMLASVASQSGGAPLATALGVGVGVPSGTGCALTQWVSAQPGLISQLQHTINSGVHCVSIFDEGAMTTPVYFALRFSHP